MSNNEPSGNVEIVGANDPEFLVNTYIENEQTNSSITVLSDGGWVITWQSEGQDGDGLGIYGQRYSADGTPRGEEFQVNTFIDGDQSNPSVTSLSDGGWLVAWMSFGQDGDRDGIFAQVYSSDGTPQGEEFQVNTQSRGMQRDQSVTGLSDGGWVVTWASSGQDGDRYGVFGQRYSADGTPLGEEFQVNTYTNQQQTNPSITGLSDGGWVVTWMSTEGIGEYAGTSTNFVTTIFGQRYSSDGTAVGEEFPVNIDVFVPGAFYRSALNPSVTDLTDGGWIVTWHSGIHIFAQRYSDEGAPQGEEFQVNPVDPQGLYDRVLRPSVTGLSDGGWIVTWASLDQSEIIAQRYSNDGQAQGEAFLVSAYSSEEYEATPISLSGLNDGGWVITWNSSNDIFGQLYLPFQEDTELSINNTLSDPDGLGSFTYQWLRDGAEIDGATGNTYTLVQDDVGSAISVRVSYTDGEGNEETIVSGETLPIAPKETALDETGTDGPDNFVGTSLDDRFDGLAGNDSASGGEGNDGLKGGDGDDLLVGGPGDDRLPGGDGNDTSYGGEGDDRLGGGFGDDYMDGGDGNDGGGAGPGSDTVIGGDGNDQFNGGYGSDYIDLGEGDDRSGASFGNDTMFGGAGNDLLTGGDGNDQINGDAGDDTINSGYGADTVTGGEGADLFIFNSLYGGDTTVITDFEDDIDVIRVVGLRNPPDPLGRLDIQNITYDGEAAATFTYGDHTVIVQGVSASDLTETDFLFT